MGHEVLSEDQLAKLTHVSHFVAEMANMTPRDNAPFVGRDAFTHKGGMHADAVRKLKTSYEHVPPESVGNTTTISVSEMAGRSSLLQKAFDFGLELDRNAPETKEVLKRVKDLENAGYEFEGADASLELLMRRTRGEFEPFFTLRGFRVSVDRHDPTLRASTEATVKIDLPDGTPRHTAAEGNGPVDALNNALRAALDDCYPELKTVHLEDYKVRIIDAQSATRAKTRVLIESTDGDNGWDTVGVSENIIAASYKALVDSIEFKLLHTRVLETT
jgi:2-isopropylmalate synthase